MSPIWKAAAQGRARQTSPMSPRINPARMNLKYREFPLGRLRAKSTKSMDSGALKNKPSQTKPDVSAQSSPERRAARMKLQLKPRTGHRALFRSNASGSWFSKACSRGIPAPSGLLNLFLGGPALLYENASRFSGSPLKPRSGFPRRASLRKPKSLPSRSLKRTL